VEVKEEEFVYPVEALEALQEKDEDDLSHEQMIALENLTRHTRVKDVDTLEELHDEFSEIEDLKEKHIYKLLELVPQRESTIRSIFSKERVKLDDSQVEEILELCQSIEVESEE
jgi:DNA-directed RNA polymerase subunit F